jgi:hypothetical protein
VPPDEWSPPPGWEPDPSWPSPPNDWQWWQPVTRRKRRRVRAIALGVLIAVGSLVVVALIAADAADMAKGCGSIDPTDPANYSVVTIVNDTGQSVRIANCAGTECSPGGPSNLAPGQRITAHAACAATGKDMTSFEIAATGSGQTLGYVAVQTEHSNDRPTYRISTLSRNPFTPTPIG